MQLHPQTDLDPPQPSQRNWCAPWGARGPLTKIHPGPRPQAEEGWGLSFPQCNQGVELGRCSAISTSIIYTGHNMALSVYGRQALNQQDFRAPSILLNTHLFCNPRYSCCAARTSGACAHPQHQSEEKVRGRGWTPGGSRGPVMNRALVPQPQ